GRLIDGLSGSPAASFDGLLHYLAGRAQGRTQAWALRAARDRQARPLASPCSVCASPIRYNYCYSNLAKPAVRQTTEPVSKTVTPRGLDPGTPANIAPSRNRLSLMGGAADFPSPPCPP